MSIAFIGGTVIDGTGADPMPETTIVVEESKIVEITQQTEFGHDVDVYDISGRTILPGLIDTHVHFAEWAQWLITSQKHPLSYLAAETICRMRATLERGVTSARDMGGLEIGFCQAQEAGLIPGPRTKAVLVIIQATNGLTDFMPGVGGTITPQGLSAFMPGIPTPWANGADGVREKVREVLRYGADFIKIAQTSVPWAQQHRPDRPCFTPAELEAIVDEAHRAGTEVCCHVIGYESTDSTWEAIQAGVDLIDHGSFLDDRCVEEMAKRNIWYCPMFSIMDFHATRNQNPMVNPIGARTLELTKESFKKALAAGVRICLGTDQPFEIPWQGREIKFMIECGMTPMQAIVASTKSSAEALHMDNLVGTLEVGKEADLLVIDGNPLETHDIFCDPNNLQLVMQAGKPFSGTLAASFPKPPMAKVVNFYRPF